LEDAPFSKGIKPCLGTLRISENLLDVGVSARASHSLTTLVLFRQHMQATLLRFCPFSPLFSERHIGFSTFDEDRVLELFLLITILLQDFWPNEYLREWEVEMNRGEKGRSEEVWLAYAA